MFLKNKIINQKLQFLQSHNHDNLVNMEAAILLQKKPMKGNILNSQLSTLNSLKENDYREWKLFYEANFGMVCKLVTNNSGTREDATEIYQDSLIVLTEKIQQPDFKLTSKLSTLLYGIASNKWQKELRKRKGKSFWSFPTTDGSEDEAGSFKFLAIVRELFKTGHYVDEEQTAYSDNELLEDDSGQVTSRYEMAMDIVNEMISMPKFTKCRKVIEGFYLDSMRHRDLASMLGITEKSSKIQKYRCEKKLKFLVKQHPMIKRHFLS